MKNSSYKTRFWEAVLQPKHIKLYKHEEKGMVYLLTMFQKEKFWISRWNYRLFFSFARNFWTTQPICTKQTVEMERCFLFRKISKTTRRLITSPPIGQGNPKSHFGQNRGLAENRVPRWPPLIFGAVRAILFWHRAAFMLVTTEILGQSR